MYSAKLSLLSAQRQHTSFHSSFCVILLSDCTYIHYDKRNVGVFSQPVNPHSFKNVYVYIKNQPNKPQGTVKRTEYVSLKLKTICHPKLIQEKSTKCPLDRQEDTNQIPNTFYHWNLLRIQKSLRSNCLCTNLTQCLKSFHCMVLRGSNLDPLHHISFPLLTKALNSNPQF